MKHYGSPYLILVGLVCLQACNQQTKNQSDASLEGEKHHIAGHIHNPTCGTCQKHLSTDFVYFRPLREKEFFVCLNSRNEKIDSTDYGKTEFYATFKKIEIKGIGAPRSLYLAYDLCRGTSSACHPPNSPKITLPDVIVVTKEQNEGAPKKIGKIKAPFSAMGHYYDYNDMYGFLVENLTEKPKTFFINTENIILLPEKEVTYKVVSLAVEVKKDGMNSESFMFDLAYGLEEAQPAPAISLNQ